MTKEQATREALRMALEALQDYVDEYGPWSDDSGAQYVLRVGKEALQSNEQVEPVAWEGGEGWESLAWELCADENGEESCNELIWEGGPIPEPWGDRWMKYESEAKRLIALVHKHTHPPVPTAQPEQEPVAGDMTAERAAYFVRRFKHEEKLLGPNEQAALDFVLAMLTTPPQRKPLTDEEIADIVVEMNGNEPTALFWRDLARAIEAAHNITAAKGEDTKEGNMK